MCMPVLMLFTRHLPQSAVKDNIPCEFKPLVCPDVVILAPYVVVLAFFLSKAAPSITFSG